MKLGNLELHSNTQKSGKDVAGLFMCRTHKLRLYCLEGGRPSAVYSRRKILYKQKDKRLALELAQWQYYSPQSPVWKIMKKKNLFFI